MLGTSEEINRWLRKRRERAYAEGVQEGFAERDQEWRAWNAERIAAEERGERFDVPPPGSDDETNGVLLSDRLSINDTGTPY